MDRVSIMLSGNPLLSTPPSPPSINGGENICVLHNSSSACVRGGMGWGFLDFLACLLFMGVSFLLLPTPASAAIQWSLSVVEGYYQPSLDDLNYVLKYKGVELGPRNTEAKPAPYAVVYQGSSPDNMPDMSPLSPKIGLQFQADINPRYALIFGSTVATFDSMKRDVRPFFVGFSIPATRETRFSLLLNQFWLGARRYWVWGEPVDRSKKQEVTGQKDVGIRNRHSDKATEVVKQGQQTLSYIKERTRVYGEMGILAVTRASLTTDVWLHVYAPEDGFDFYKVTETGARGSGYATYIGMGGEYFIKRWLSLGLDLDYIIGGVKDLKFDHFFTVDPLEKDIIKIGDKVLTTDLRNGRIKPLFIDLEGLDYKLQIRVYF